MYISHWERIFDWLRFLSSIVIDEKKIMINFIVRLSFDRAIDRFNETRIISIAMIFIRVQKKTENGSTCVFNVNDAVIIVVIRFSFLQCKFLFALNEPGRVQG